MKYIYYFDTPVGEIGIADENGKITNVFFVKSDECRNKNIEQKETLLISCAINQLNEYFSKQRRVFDIPLKTEGTAFQKRVWNKLTEINYGETKSYKQITNEIGMLGAQRAVGGANNKNPIAIIIPCHRVIGSNGKLTGYGGGLDVKKKLLDIECK